MKFVRFLLTKIPLAVTYELAISFSQSSYQLRLPNSHPKSSSDSRTGSLNFPIRCQVTRISQSNVTNDTSVILGVLHHHFRNLPECIVTPHNIQESIGIHKQELNSKTSQARLHRQDFTGKNSQAGFYRQVLTGKASQAVTHRPEIVNPQKYNST